MVDQYQTTTHVPEALERLTECYLALGLTDEAQKTAAVLGYNYPGSEWYERRLRAGHAAEAASNRDWTSRRQRLFGVFGPGPLRPWKRDPD